MGSPRVRVVITTQSGQKVKSDWNPKDGPEAFEAMLKLIRGQTDLRCYSTENNYNGLELRLP
jgi:hypothetical protein